MTFGFGQFLKLRKQKLADGTKYLGSGPSYPAFIPTVSGGSTSVIPGIDGFQYTTFTGSGPLVINSPTTVDILIIAGGGAGGGRVSSSDPTPDNRYGFGGGGAGGVGFVSAYTFSAGTYNVYIGSGSASPLSSGSRGEDSYIVNVGTGVTIIRAIGGGNGEASSPGLPFSGGSGGGSSDFNPVTSTGAAGVQPTTTQPGLVGGVLFSYGSSGGSSSYGGAGGGGGTSNGSNGGNPTYGGGPGGSGVRDFPAPDSPSRNFPGPIIGVPVLNPFAGKYAGGGGGGTFSASPGVGGNATHGGGGGGGSVGTYAAGTSADGGNPGTIGSGPGISGSGGTGGNGFTNTGGGGGGAGGNGPNGISTTSGGQGGSGLVVIRQKII